METAQKLDALRKLMKAHGMAAYLVVTEDYHGSEYVGEFFKEREYLSGFDGSAGSLVIFRDSAALWTDGRYFLQAERQLRGSGIELMKAGQPGVPALEKYICDKLNEGDILGFDGRTVSFSLAERISSVTDKKHISFDPTCDLAGEIWRDRPALSAGPVWELGTEYCCESREEKLARLRAEMKKSGTDSLVLTSLEEIAYLLNLRGGDVRCTPVFLAFMLIDKNGAELFANPGIFSPAIKEKLDRAGVRISAYEGIYAALGAIPSGSRLMLDGRSANCLIVSSVNGGVEKLDRESPVVMMKALKNATEAENMRRAHIADGVALTRFIRWLKQNAGRSGITEMSAAAKLEEFRKEAPDYIGPSFDPIIAYGEHGAIVHYEPTEKTDVPIKAEGLCLCDTGGHYLRGTTDVTRTVAVGALDGEEKKAFTLVLKGHLALGAAKFKAGTSGVSLDCLAREPLWSEGLDYNHGTGHGVGYLLSVHEGPQRIGAGGTRPLADGMIISDEPGLYIPGKFGVRTESLVLVKSAEDNEFGSFKNFETLTVVPIDKEAIDLSIMDESDRSRLNTYHEKVFGALSPYFEGEELEWLRDATAPV